MLTAPSPRTGAPMRRKADCRPTHRVGFALRLACLLGVLCLTLGMGIITKWAHGEEGAGVEAGGSRAPGLAALAADGQPQCSTLACHGECMAKWEVNGGLAFYAFAIVYLFTALAVVCDDYFVASLELISERLNLSEDVAGATFMAAGSSAPELFVSLADNVFSTPRSVGIGAIIGSAIFNILIIIASTALLAGQVLLLDWRPLARDTCWYLFSIILLFAFVQDQYVQWYEALILFASYGLYILYMAFNPRILAKCNQHSQRDPAGPQSARAVGTETGGPKGPASRAVYVVQAELGSRGATDEERPAPSAARTAEHRQSVEPADLRSAGNAPQRSRSRSSSGGAKRLTRGHSGGSLHKEGGAGEAKTPGEEGDAPGTPFGAVYTGESSAFYGKEHGASVAANAGGGGGEEDEDEDLGAYWHPLYPPREGGARAWTWYVFAIPFLAAMRATVPDCQYKMFKGWPGILASFILSIAWIGLLSHYAVLCAERVGCILGIPSPVMGLTVIAAGTSVPDALSSVIVAREGQGDMAVSNAIGSNVFDILIGLGLPFFLASTLVHQDITDDNGVPAVPVATGALWISIIILFAIVVLLFGLLLCTRWRLFPHVGVVLIVTYVAYVVFALAFGIAG